MTLNLTTIILTYNEELHIKRCLDNVCPIAREVYIIDSFSTDRTLEIAREYANVKVLQNKWENNYAKQFNWGLSHADIRTKWVLRLDADEYLLPELIEELDKKLPTLDENITGIVVKRRHIFMDKWMKRGTYPVKLLRFWRTGKAICEQRLMDEHIQLLSGEQIEFDNDFCDHNLNNLTWFVIKHANYAIREAADLLDIEYDITGSGVTDGDKMLNEQAKAKRMRKHKYATKPLFWRSFAYFCYRYFFKLGFLEGKEGFLWHFLQGWWYRTLCDAKVYEVKKACGSDPEKIKAYLWEQYKIRI